MTLAYQHILFASHAKDLCAVCNITEELFVCPICLEVFSSDGLEQGHMDVGHVWPHYIRQKSEVAKHQHILLCKSCNSKAGKTADAAMQEYERIVEIVESGVSHKPAAVQVFLPGRPDLRPIRIRASVNSKVEEKRLNIRLEDPKTAQQQENHRAILAKIDQYLQHGKISIAVESPVRAHLAQIGWLTSAYLLAFFKFGYRYILQDRLAPVREHILASFTPGTMPDHRLGEPGITDTAVYRGNSNSCADPTIGLFLSVREDIPHHLQINFLACQMRLPLPQMPEALTWDVPPNADEVLGAFVDADTQTPPATIDWSVVFGETTWTVNERALIRRSS